MTTKKHPVNKHTVIDHPVSSMSAYRMNVCSSVSQSSAIVCICISYPCLMCRLPFLHQVADGPHQVLLHSDNFL